MDNHTVAVIAGIGGVILSLIVVLFVGLDLYYEWRDEQPLEQRLDAWADRFPFLAGGLVLVLGALLSHFFWQPFL